jgi:hypothetical protein
VNDLVEFLKDRLDEDEHFARRTHSGEWTFDTLGQLLVNQGQTISKIANLGVDNFGWHIARHDPARVLREVEAKRLLLQLHRECDAQCYILKVLALPYADHPSYNEAWRP